MLKLKHKEVLEWLDELDTGKAQPLFHPFPIINIFREDKEGKTKTLHEKSDEEKLLFGITGEARGFSGEFKGEAILRAQMEGAQMEGEELDFYLQADGDGLTLKNAAAQGWVSLKPTLGTISRHGLCVDSPSLTQLAINGKDVATCAKVLEAVAAVDKKDPMSRDCYIYDFTQAQTDDVAGMKIAVPFTMFGVQPTPAQLTAFQNICETLEEKGAQIEGVDLEWEDYILPVHEMIGACEKTMQLKTRENLPDIPRYDMELGDFLLSRENYDAYYIKLLKVRSLMKDAIDKMLRDYALLMVPFVWEEDIYLTVANLAGIPSLAMDGVEMITGANQEKNLIKAAYACKKEVL